MPARIVASGFFGAKLSFADIGKRRGLPRCPLSLRSVLEVVNPGRRGREINGERQGEGSASKGGALPEPGSYRPPKRKTMPAWRRKSFSLVPLDLV